MAEEKKIESRLEGLERMAKIMVALILTSLSCSLVALLLALITLLTTD